ncbi:MAG: HypC/HybG/HupF family hydrogenase formation chaperone [Bacillota bacterium]
MCLAVPAQVKSCDGNEAIVDLHGNRVRVSTLLVPEVKDGDWVLVHAGFAIQQINAETLEETWAVLEDLKKAGGQP